MTTGFASKYIFLHAQRNVVHINLHGETTPPGRCLKRVPVDFPPFNLLKYSPDAMYPAMRETPAIAIPYIILLYTYITSHHHGQTQH